jgi:hypothetical protein
MHRHALRREALAQSRRSSARTNSIANAAPRRPMPERREMMRAALRRVICGVIGLILVAWTLMRMFYESLPTKWNMAKYLFGYNVLIGTIIYLFIIRPWREEALEVDKDDQEVTTSKTAPKIKIREVDDAPPTVYDRQMRLYDARLQAARVESLKRRAAISLRAH